MTAFDKHTFLVVDDEEFSRSMVQRMLKRAGAMEVVTVADGHQAISALNQLPITVMITDFHMPGLHGLQLLKNVRLGQTKAPRNLICAMLTGHAVRHLVGLAIVLDVDSFLAKPVSPETLTRHLARAFQYRFEPLAIENYERIDVAGADQFLTGRAPEGQPEKAKEEEEVVQPPSQDSSAPEALQPETTKARPVAAKPERPSAPVRPAASAKPARDTFAAPAKVPQGEAIRVALKDVPENAVLARNIIGSSGTLLLAAGTPFRSRYVRRLQELKEMEGEIEHVWITPG